MINFNELVYKASEVGASDFHLTVGMPPIYRIDGDLVDATEELLQEEDVAGVVRILANDAQQEELKREGQTDFAVTYDGKIRMRCNASISRGTRRWRCVCFR